MAGRDFNMVYALIAACICAHMDVVLSQAAPPTSNYAGSYVESADADFGVRMWYSQADGDTALKVTISYDTETDVAKNFFTTQLTDKLIDDLDSCKTVTLVFNPCTTSKLDQQKLVCLLGTTQCYLDQVHSCVSSALHDGSVMGKFLICIYSGKSTAECGKTVGVEEPKIKTCVNDGTGAKNCDHYHTVFVDAKTKRATSEGDPSQKPPDSITGFKAAVCQVLAQASLKCAKVCG